MFSPYQLAEEPVARTSRPQTRKRIEMTEQTPQVYAAIASVMADMAKEGISKASKNAQQGYVFRGIDAVYNALAPKLAALGGFTVGEPASR